LKLRFAVPALAVAIAFAVAPSARAAVSVPSGFVVEDAAPGVSWNTPTAIAFVPGGRMLVAEKLGRVWIVSKDGIRNPAPLWDRPLEVLNEGDRGLLGLAVDPNYVTNHYIYLFYTCDPDSSGVDDELEAFGRLTRYQVSFADSNALDLSSRTILIGTDWRHGAGIGSETHTIADLEWGSDGSLLCSIGDGSNEIVVDAGGITPGMFGATKTDPAEDVGSFRSQDINSLDGKVLRINPADGHGYPSNPYWDGNATSVRSRVWVYGLRNPFRFTVRPGTGSTNPTDGNPGVLYIGDVGWKTWEEQNIAITSGKNFGWPCYEGLGTQGGYQGASPSNYGCSTIGTGINPGTLTSPTITYNHDDPALGTPPGFSGNCAMGGVFYTGAIYPAAYQSKYFMPDFGQSFIKLCTFNGSQALTALTDFALNADGPVCTKLEPQFKDIFYVAINFGKVRRIRYTGTFAGDQLPIVNAAGAPTSGAAPLTVNFSSAGTSDPDGDPLALFWNFGDLTGSSAANPSHVYTVAGTYNAVLTAQDGHGGLVRDTVVVTVTGGDVFPSTPIRDNFNRPDGPVGAPWVGDLVGLVVGGNELAPTSDNNYAIWNGTTFGVNQEAYYTFTNVRQCEQDLMLKCQGTSYTAGHILVVYDHTQSKVQVKTYESGAWTNRGSYIPVTFGNGDVFGARAYSNGTVDVFKNGVKVGSVSVSGWSFASSGGRIGVALFAVCPTRVDNFGGGNFTPGANTAPLASISAPVDSSKFYAGLTINCVGDGVDAQDASNAMTYNWLVNMHHNTHVHPSVAVGTGKNFSFVAGNHDDGTGFFYEINLMVTDTGGLIDTAQVNIFPEVDLSPSSVTVPPDTTQCQYRFKIRNFGRMPAPINHWALTAYPSILLGQGDVIVPALDSLIICVPNPPILSGGQHTIRARVDSLGAIVEMDETNNSWTGSLQPAVTGVGPPGMPTTLTLSGAFPNPTSGTTSFALELPVAGRVRFSIHDLLGREVWSAGETEFPAGHTTLMWNGTTNGGHAAATGMYLARVRVDGHALVRRLMLVR
jgi:glucose/arabinose dehydrogenase/PKD repeat protein